MVLQYQTIVIRMSQYRYYYSTLLILSQVAILVKERNTYEMYLCGFNNHRCKGVIYVRTYAHASIISGLREGFSGVSGNSQNFRAGATIKAKKLV